MTPRRVGEGKGQQLDNGRLDRWDAALRLQAGRGPAAATTSPPLSPTDDSSRVFALLDRWSRIGAPVFAGDEGKTRDAGTLNMVLLGLAVYLLMNVVGAALIYSQKTGASGLLVALFVVILASHWLMRRGPVYVASLTLVSGLWLLYSVQITFSGAVYGAGALSYAFVCVVAGLLLGPRAAVTVLIASTLAFIALAAAQALGHPPHQYFPSRPVAMVTFYAFFLPLFLGIQAFQSMRHALALEHETEEQYHRVIEEAMDGILIADPTGRVLMVNTALRGMLGLTPEEIKDLQLMGTYLPEERNLLADRLKRLEAGERLRFERAMQRKDGTTIQVEVTASRLDDGRMEGIVRDVSERTRAERALRESEERFRRLSAAAFEGIAITDAGKIVDMNSQFAEILGYEVAELVGRSVLDLVAPEHHELVLGHIRSGSSDRYEHLALRKDGGRVPVEVQGRNIPFQGRNLRVTAVRDITGRLELEAQFRQAQKMEAVGQLAGGVAHDFNNLLTAIVGYTQLLLMDLAADDARREDVEQIAVAADRATGLTRQLLAFSRRQVLQPKELSLGAVVIGAERLLQRLIGEDVTLVTRSQPNLGLVRADEGQLEQVIVNLAVNARDAMPEGGTLSIETSNVEVGTARPAELSAVPPGAYVLLTVRDTGMGMDAETCARIFEPFFTTKPEGRGTGLGLSTVYGIVKQSGGFVTVTSAPHEGALFSIYLPRIPGEVAPRAPEAPRRAAPRGNEVVLLADDDAGVRSAVSRELRMQGYTVIEASDGQSALRASAKADEPIALLITDVVMPQLSGPALAKRLTAERPRLKVLYVSGYADNALGRHGVLESGIHFLQKPFKPDALAQKVREILDGAPGG